MAFLEVDTTQGQTARKYLLVLVSRYRYGGQPLDAPREFYLEIRVMSDVPASFFEMESQFVGVKYVAPLPLSRTPLTFRGPYARFGESLNDDDAVIYHSDLRRTLAELDELLEAVGDAPDRPERLAELVRITKVDGIKIIRDDADLWFDAARSADAAAHISVLVDEYYETVAFDGLT